MSDHGYSIAQRYRSFMTGIPKQVKSGESKEMFFLRYIWTVHEYYLTHLELVTPHGIVYLGPYWFR